MDQGKLRRPRGYPPPQPSPGPRESPPNSGRWGPVLPEVGGALPSPGDPNVSLDSIQPAEGSGRALFDPNQAQGRPG